MTKKKSQAEKLRELVDSFANETAKDWNESMDDEAFGVKKPKSHPRWAVLYTKGTTSYILDHLYKTRRLARMAAGNGKRPWYRAVKVIVQEV